MPNKHALLVAEDNAINRKILNKILAPDYEIIMAENGREALEHTKKNADRLAAVILDIEMPIMNGFDYLKAISGCEEYSNIPIVVATGNNDSDNEAMALELGAWDFVSKPYDAKILKFRLRNAIERSKLNLLDQLKYQSEHDNLTGLYNSKRFYQEIQNLIKAKPDNNYAMLRFDVDRFKQYNGMYGTDAGDDFLNHIAWLLRNLGQRYSEYIYARIEGDVFGVFTSYLDKDTLIKSIENCRSLIKEYSKQFDVVTVFGVYYVDDKNIPPIEMLDRATLAAKSCKGKYIGTIAEYSDKMGEAQKIEQEITNEMNAALEQEQFCVYYQPKYNIAVNEPCGAEALVRWKHPVKGMVSPGFFIPTFEKNGFIAKVDYYVWRKTCENLKKWCDLGWNPSPVSVNVSRVNLNNPNVAEIITALVNEYGIEPRLLQLEITESAYMDSPEIMDRIVGEFHKRGFTVLMDDFGSGYSSLNTLKEISVDILKIDMKFLPTGETNTKSEKILASIIRMADWLGMPVVVEGVETRAQKDFLQSVGCMYVQGYYYGRPMPVDEYEQLVCNPISSGEQRCSEEAEHAELDALMSSDPKTEALLRSISVPVVIYEYQNRTLDRVRANQRFFDTFGYQSNSADKTLNVTDDEKEKVCSAVDKVISTKASAECEVMFVMAGGAAKWYRLHISYIMPSQNGHIICAVYTDISQEKKVEAEMSGIVGILNRNDCKKGKMLIVDDSEISRDMLRAIFENEFDIIEAPNGITAVDILQVQKYEISIILLDMIMPEMDGAEFLATKNHMEGTGDIPVIIISSDRRQDIQVSMLRSGVNDYITKPFVPEVVSRRVHNVLEYQSRFVELVGEFKQAISLSPSISPNLMKAYLTLAETRAMVSFMGPIFDVVRIVDPTDTCVITINDNDEICREPYSCFKVWNKQTRCENCTSMCAANNGCQMSKYEFIENNIFYVVSRPIEILIDGKSPVKVVMEIVSHVSDSLMSQEYNGIPVRKILESTRQKIYCDPLTTAYNRRYLYEMLFVHQGRTGVAKQIAVIMADMNGFKNINDEYGHGEGDRVLSETAHAMMDQLRHSDSVIRYGGDEFIIILTNCDVAQVDVAIKRLSQAVSGVSYGEGKSASAKFGYSYTENFEPTREFLEDMIRRADENMYNNRRLELELKNI